MDPTVDSEPVSESPFEQENAYDQAEATEPMNESFNSNENDERDEAEDAANANYDANDGEIMNNTDEKRSLRPARADKRVDHMEDSDAEVDSDAEDFHQACLLNSLTALKQYFYNRLEQTVVFLGGSVDHLKGWKVQVLKRTGGLTLGIVEVFYFSNRGKKFRSRVEVACFLNLMPSIKSIRTMTRDQFYLNAIETRERHLISQQLALCNFSCEDIIFHNDVITLVSSGIEKSVELATGASPDSSAEKKAASAAPEEEAAEVKPVIDFRTAKNLYFSFGNMVVLDWGRLVPDTAFHTNNQLYPLGFRCLRQEHDVALDRVVDCLCEIDAVFEGGDGASVLQMIRTQGSNLQVDPRRALLPLFRLSVAWHVGDEITIGTPAEQDHVQVRVYEERSPQQAWQAAMLEGLGINDDSLLTVRPVAIPEDQESAEGEEDENMTDAASGEEVDEEELALRVKIREQRRAYFRVLRAEQSAGMQAAVRPRLSLDTVDSFAEELVMRLFEGMEGSINCRNYSFMDSRDREAGRKNMLKGYTKAFTKAKNLDRVIRKNVYLAEQIQQLEQKRRRVEDQESRKRAKIEDKEMRSLVISAQKSRTAKMREMEKNITLLKVAMAKTVKKRRDDAKLFAEILCDKEEMLRFSRANGISGSPTTPAIVNAEADSGAMATDEVVCAEPRPEPVESAIVLDGRVVGRFLEIWEYLSTFSADIQLPTDQIPSVDQIIQAARVCDPAYRTVKQYTRSLERCFDRVVQHQVADPTEAQATQLMNTLGVYYCQSLVKEFERVMGIDVAELQLGALRVPVNVLTWREIARVVLLNVCCRDLGVGDIDIAALLKGRGFFTTPESADRKVLKLARRRIKFNYVIRSELQESVYGFTSGLCVRLPAPGTPYIEGTVLWSDLIGSLKDVPDTCGWLIYEVIKAAALAVCIIDTTAAAKKLKQSLLRTLGLTSFRMDDGAATKAAALQILAEEERVQWRSTGGRWRKTVAPSATSTAAGTVSSSASSADEEAGAEEVASAVCQRLKLVYDETPYMIPPSTLHLWQKQLREAIRHADFGKATSAAVASALDASNQEDAERELGSAMEEDAEPVEVLDEPAKEAEDKPACDVASIDDDTKQAEKLSIAMQRCYLVIRDLMMHPQANPFNWPVDFAVIPGYYKSIAQPLSLSEVRKFLVEGHYNDSIFAFYCDVMLVIENAMAYNQENSAVKLSAQKVLLVFERLFFETVLCWDNPLPFHDSCHACRSPHPITISKAAVCDRCEGSYHLHCLDPPMHTPPRSEWYCIPCIEQKGVPTAHPYKTADVMHPTDPEARGEVVGMEQMRQTVMFVVEFGSVRELWDGQKVRKYALEPTLEEAVLPKGTFVLKDDVDANKGSLGFSSAASSSSAVSQSSEGNAKPAEPEPAQSVYVMPSGYNYEDYDRVCGIARAYTGWGASHYLVPPVLMDEHNLTAQARSKHDVMFSQFRESVAALGPASGGVLGDVMSADEWATVLSSLQHRVLDGSTLNAALAQKDDVVDDDLIAQIQEGVHTNSLPLEKIFGFVRGEGLIKTVKVIDPDAPVDPPRRGRKRRVDPNNPVPGAPLKTVTSVSSAVGEEEEPAADEEDGEDEWDEDMDEILPSAASAGASSAKKGDEKKEKAPGSGKKGAGRGKAKKVVLDDDEEEEMYFDEPVTPKAGPSATQSTADNADETDSADEDDLEFYDEHGNCLTSAVVDASSALSPPAVQVQPSPAPGSEYVVGTDADPRCVVNVSPFSGAAVVEEEPKPSGPETEEEWDLRLLSRQKGREDALLTHTLVLDTITQLDVDGSKEGEEDIFKQVSKDDLGGDFYSYAVGAIVKSCLGRPSESLVAHEWTKGWEAKMTAMDKYLHEFTFQDKEMLCPICGFEEGYLSSPFVWGQTNDEWEADVAADTAQDVLTEPEPPNDVNAFPLAAGVSASTGIKGFRARYRVMKGLVWMPYNTEEAEVEEVECKSAKRPLKGGSLVMHECCANFMHFNRQMKQDKSRKMEDQRIVEVISGIGRAKCTPIGIDREGSFYWILRGCKALFVSTGGMETLREKAAQRTPPPAGRWSMYRNEAEISDVLCWLDPKIATERVLRKTLSILFPKAVTGDEEAVTKAPAITDAPAPTEGTAVVPEVKEEISAESESTMDVVEEAAVAPQSTHSFQHSSLLNGDIMEQSGDEGDSDEEGADAAKSSATEATEQQDEEEEEEEVEVGTRSPLRRQCKNGNTESSATAMEVTETAEADKFTPAELLLAQQRKEAAIATVAQRPAVSQRSQLLDIYAPLVDPAEEGAVASSSSGKSASFKYRKGEHVLVDASTHNHILWDARVLEMKSTKVKCGAPPDEHTEHILYYKVRFDRWGSGYDGWYEECQLVSVNATLSAVGRPRVTGRELAQESKLKFLRQEIWTPPAVLQTLLAHKFMDEPQRACGTRPRMTYSDCESAISQLRTAMLMVEAALPFGAIDDSDDRWGEDFVVPWREAVAVASDAISLMQCQLMLEYGIRTSWLKPAGLKMFSCLPSRVQCARNATCGLVAIRIWVLDMTIKYDQVKKDDKPLPSGSGKGRPPKAGGAAAGKGAASGASKKAKKFY